jgi:hypothetical protein
MKAERFFEGDPVEIDEGWGGDIRPPPRTRQDIFDRVVRHHRKQRTRCPALGRCFYRFAGDRCFIGALIDDADYDPEMEGLKVRELMNWLPVSQWFCDNIDLIEDLQNIHDTETNWPDGRMDMVLELFAAERGLKMPDETII